MIILDENIRRPLVRDGIAQWYAGKVLIITDLRPGSRVLDEAVPMLLRHEQRPTFITTNVDDFWRRCPADGRYCVICVPLPNSRQGEIPGVVRRVLRSPGFQSRSARMGKVALVSGTAVRFYCAGDDTERAVELA